MLTGLRLKLSATLLDQKKLDVVDEQALALQRKFGPLCPSLKCLKYRLITRRTLTWPFKR